MSEETDAAAPAKKTAKKKQAVVRALKTPVAVPGATIAKGGKATINLETAKHKEEQGEVEIIEIL